jgi:hypothetical protein
VKIFTGNIDTKKNLTANNGGIHTYHTAVTDQLSSLTSTSHDLEEELIKLHRTAEEAHVGILKIYLHYYTIR